MEDGYLSLYWKGEEIPGSAQSVQWWSETIGDTIKIEVDREVHWADVELADQMVLAVDGNPILTFPIKGKFWPGASVHFAP